jgi:hypothetical protein
MLSHTTLASGTETRTIATPPLPGGVDKQCSGDDSSAS